MAAARTRESSAVGAIGNTNLPTSWFTIEGSAHPLGVVWLEEERAFNFALYSNHATGVSLLLFTPDQLGQPCRRIDLNHLVNKSGRIWHCRVPESELGGAIYYGYQVQGPAGGRKYDLHAFDDQKLLIDPYATEIHFPDSFDRAAAIRPGSNVGKAPLGVLPSVKEQEASPWKADRVRFHEHDLVIYELHVRGFTRNPNSGVDSQRRGTYLGAIDKIPYLVELGITAVELMPVFQFDPQENNFWGYMPLNFFAPHSQYATHQRNAAREFRQMVSAFHQAGIEVLLDVVFNHTTEGDEHGPCYSFKGIDNSSYYITTGDPAHPFANFSGTGNTLHTKNRHTVRMILDSMRSWVRNYHVDGFRFDLASVFNRRGDGSVSSSQSRLVAAIRADPVLGKVRLIAEPWDAAGLNQLGQGFPGKRWMQWNGRFRDDVRRFVKGDAGLLAEMVRRMYGSDDLFPDSLNEACHPYQSVNYINSHDGFTLYDQVSYNQRHNWVNGEQNRDGHRDNHSWNCGVEGDAGASDEIIKLRIRQAKNFCCLLMLANGTPMFRAGDEFLQTQYGNNNPFNQDNKFSWLDWDRLQEHAVFHRFFRMMIAFRKSHPTIARSRFWREDVRWYGTGADVDWSYDARQFAYFLCGESQRDIDLYVMVNADWRPHTFSIQHYESSDWEVAVNTAAATPDDIYDSGQGPRLRSRQFSVAARSVVVLRSCRATEADAEKAEITGPPNKPR
ncbi:Glycogen debranching enzyme [Stieleria maiorica]|uniref:Glycogen debranching enzyme n=1 Tax=Stieleria maiorica TaxID=2795974 RepID=A0A5B9MBR0_9BACT|nr:Glycogen debranching enzyme [Stieleria maiorica]